MWVYVYNLVCCVLHSCVCVCVVYPQTRTASSCRLRSSSCEAAGLGFVLIVYMCAVYTIFPFFCSLSLSLLISRFCLRLRLLRSLP